jgi:hypothetical protein
VLNPTYKHLGAKLRLGAFTMAQWTQIAVAGAIAAVFAVYVSPLPTTVTIFVSILGAGLPVATSYGAMGLEFSVGQFVVSAWRYSRAPRHYLPGPGRTALGYAVESDQAPVADASPPGDADVQAGEAEGLWDF